MVKKATRPAIFKWRQMAPKLILCAVRWYLQYSLSLRGVEELLTERGLHADHTTIWRWVQRYGPEQEQRLRRHLKPTNSSRPTNPGVWTRPTFACGGVGVISIGRLNPRVPPSTSCCRRCAIPRRPKACSAGLSAIHRTPSPASSILIRLGSTARRLPEPKRKEPCAAAADIDRSNI
jgi:hypothetical protein